MPKYNLKKYLVLSFVTAWVFQIVGSVFALQGSQMGFTSVLAFSMFMPLLAVLLTEKSLKKEKTGIDWKLHLKKGWKFWLIAWLSPMVLTLLGSLIYFLIFPYKFDPTLSEYLIATGGVAAYAQIAATMDMRVYFVVMLIQILFASFINAPFALGEEAGWRGYMYPALKQRFGVTKGRIIGGLVWGSWHWPVMILTGYEYGWSVFNAPWYLVIAGLLLFPVFTVSIGIMLDWLYEKTGSIWSTALFHGAINTCNFCMVLLKVEYAGDMYLGPHPIGIISGLPFLIIATIICVKSARKN